MKLPFPCFLPATFISVRHRRHVLRAGLLTVASSVVFAQGEPKTDETIRLPEFTVSSTKANQYRATDSISVSRIRAGLVDTPASVSVITSEFLQDIGANAMYDATKYFSGIGNGRGAGTGGIVDRQTIRGFENDSSGNGRTIDNFATGFQANLDPMLYERVEIVKGPNSILAPTGTPGGQISIVTKSPKFEPSNTATVELGNFGAQKISFDSTGSVSLSKNLAYRVIGSYQDTDMFIPGKVKQWDINAQLTYRFSATSQLTLKYTYIDWGQFGPVSDANSWGWPVDPSVANGATVSATPPPGYTYDGYNGDTVWDTRTDRVNLLQAQFTHALTDKISMRLAGMFAYDHMGQRTGFPTYPGIGNRYDPTTGILTPNYTWAKDANGVFVPTFSPAFNATNVSRIATRAPVWTQNAQLQNDFAGSFKAGDVSLQPVAGWSYVGITSDSKNLTAPLPPVNLFAPDNNPPGPPDSAYSYNTYNHARNKQYQVYAAMRSGFYNDRVFITGGVSRVYVDNAATNLLKSTTAYLKGHHDAFMGGGLAKLTENVSAYYSYSSNTGPTTFNNAPLWKDGKQHEYGVKSEFFDQRLSFNAAHFQIIQTNLVTPNPAFNTDPANNPPNLISNQTNHGFEFEMVGGITKNLSLVTSYTKMKLRDAFGRQLRNIPDRTMNALLNYHFTEGSLKGAGVFVGMTHLGRVAGETPAANATALGVIEKTSFFVAPRTVYNAGASYRWERLQFNLNIDNILDEKFVWEPASRFSISPYPGINYRLTTTIKF